MPVITIYEIIQEAENKYISLWGKEGYERLRDQYISTVKLFMDKEKVSVEVATTACLSFILHEAGGGAFERDIMFISAFKIADETLKPKEAFSEVLILAITKNFIGIVDQLNKSKINKN